MHTSFSEPAVNWLARHTGIPVSEIHIQQLKGSTSSSVFHIQSHSDTTPHFVLRVLDNAQWLAEEPDLAAHEAAALTEAMRAGLAAPQPVAFAGAEAGFAAPVVLMTFVTGHVELRPDSLSAWLAGLAAQLAEIHAHTAEGFAWQFRSWVKRGPLQPPAWADAPPLFARAIELHRAGAPASPTVFIHRDYHPANVLWQHGQVSGVVDWINACRGPAGVDVAHCRSNLAIMLGVEAADAFLEHYCAADSGFHYDPYWDVDSILDAWIDGVGFYRPWQEFGLAVITPEVIRHRANAYVASVMRRV